MIEKTIPMEQPRQRLRLHYTKGEAVKFISHHDEFRLWERTLRRANLPLLYKQGFNPLPHIQFAAPLGAGFTGAQEPVDIILSPPVPLEDVAARLRAKLPPGVTLLSLEEVSPKANALASGTIGADYSILLYAAPGELPTEMLEARIAAFVAQSVIWRQRERKGEAYTYNLRPLVYECAIAAMMPSPRSTASSCACSSGPGPRAGLTKWWTRWNWMTCPGPFAGSASTLRNNRPTLPSSRPTRSSARRRSLARGHWASASNGVPAICRTPPLLLFAPVPSVSGPGTSLCEPGLSWAYADKMNCGWEQRVRRILMTGGSNGGA